MATFYFAPGQVISIPEEKMRFLPETHSHRKGKKTRHMVVVTDSEPAQSLHWDVLLACFIHSDHTALTNWDVRIPKGQTNVPRLDAESWIVIPSIQPILKSDVSADLGLLGLDIMSEVYARLLEYSGMSDFLKQLEGRN